MPSVRTSHPVALRRCDVRFAVIAGWLRMYPVCPDVTRLLLVFQMEKVNKKEGAYGRPEIHWRFGLLLCNS